MENNNVEKIKAKIRALFILGDETRGATQAEAELAMEKAQELMMKFGLREMDIDEMGPEAREARAFHVNQKRVNTNRPRWMEDQYLHVILRRCYNVRVIWSTHLTTTRTGRAKQCITYVLVGDPSDISFAEMCLMELYPIMMKVYRNYLADYGIADNTVTKHSFFQGLQDGFIAARERAKETVTREVGVEKMNRYAIVLVDKDKAIQQYIKANIPTRASRSGSGPRGGGFSDHAYGAGKSVGGKIRIGEPKLGSGPKRIQ